MPDQTAIARHHRFGREMAEAHFENYPAAKFEPVALVEIMRGIMAPIAADHGTGRTELTPLVRAASASFLRRWRRLQRGK